MEMHFNLNLTYGLKPQVGGIKLPLLTDDPFSKLTGSLWLISSICIKTVDGQNWINEG